ncbi:unnamed protein product [Periconia digitata]|uniref:Uncharacterized protein n=1 Tax=Periconia digitata TaxID=1303443 RepID=A0A9W4XKF1_9PLEO|nr:unnamed protein product [Periconia digitata]
MIQCPPNPQSASRMIKPRSQSIQESIIALITLGTANCKLRNEYSTKGAIRRGKQETLRNPLIHLDRDTQSRLLIHARAPAPLFPFSLLLPSLSFCPRSQPGQLACCGPLNAITPKSSKSAKRNPDPL